jgi:hypothetical protein
LTHILSRQAVIFCASVCTLMFWAFWPRYFSRPLSQTNLHIHAHAVPMTLWCLLLFVQTYAIRTRKYWIHKQLTYASYVLVPVIVVTTIGLFHKGMQGSPPLMEHLVVNLAINLSTLAVFVVLYGLAMYYRRDVPTHARYMLCTALPLFTAFVPRLIIDSGMLVDLAMKAFGHAQISQAALVPADFVAVGMSVWDWRANRRLNVFPVVFALLVTIHVATETLYRVSFWQSFVTWFAELPLP